jgi:hypothetical protein
MPRNMTPAYLAAITSGKLLPALFIEAWFTTGPYYVWTGIGTITWNGQLWSGLGSLLGFSTIEEAGNVEAKGITIILSGGDTALLASILDEVQLGLPVVVSLGLFDSTGTTLIADPVCSWAGRMDQPTLDVPGTSATTISINCESRMLDMNVAVDRRYTNEDQQLDYPGDLGMMFVNSIQDAIIFWGSAPSGHNDL